MRIAPACTHSRTHARLAVALTLTLPCLFALVRSNGRLAMIAIAGMVVQEGVTGTKLF